MVVPTRRNFHGDDEHCFRAKVSQICHFFIISDRVFHDKIKFCILSLNLYQTHTGDSKNDPKTEMMHETNSS